MKKLCSAAFLAVLAQAAFAIGYTPSGPAPTPVPAAANIGVGFTLTNTNVSTDTGVTFSTNNFGCQVNGAYGFGNGWEVDPFLGFESNSISNPNNVAGGGIDGLAITTFSLGATGYQTLVTVGQFKILWGASVSIGFFGSNKNESAAAGTTETNSGYLFGISGVGTVEYRFTPSLALRLSNPIGGLSVNSSKTTLTTSAGSTGSTVTTIGFTLLPTALSLTALYFF